VTLADLVQTLDGETVAAIVDRLMPEITARLDRSPPSAIPEADGWLDSKGAAAYLGITINALHKLTAAREIPFEQDGPGCKLWFKRSELDDYRSAGRHCDVQRADRVGACLPSRFQPMPRTLDSAANPRTAALGGPQTPR
jgi:hypothetical protein